MKQGSFSEPSPGDAPKIPYFWFILAVATSAQMSVSFVHQGIATLAPFFVSDLGVSRAQVGLLSGAINIGMAFTTLIIGVLVDRLGEKVVLIAGGLLTGLTVLAASRAGSFTVLLTLLICTGFWVATATPAGSKGIMSWFPASWRGFALGFRQTGLPLGGALSAVVLPGLAMIYGWRGAMVGAGMVAISGALLVSVFYRQSSRPEKSESGGRSSGGQLKLLLHNKDLWLISFVAFAMMSAQYTVLGYLELFYHEGLGFPLRFASYMLALAQLAGMMGRIFWGLVSDRVFSGVRRYPFIADILLAAAIFLAMSFVHPGLPMWFTALLSFLIGFTAIGWNGLYIAMVSELAGGELAGTALGISLTVIQFAVLVIPPLFGAIVDRTGTYRAGWLALFFIILAGAFLLALAQEKNSGDHNTNGVNPTCQNYKI